MREGLLCYGVMSPEAEADRGRRVYPWDSVMLSSSSILGREQFLKARL